MAVNPPRNRRLVGYDLRFQNVSPRKAKEPNSDTQSGHWCVWIQCLYVADVIETKLTAAVARSWTVLRVVSTCDALRVDGLGFLTRWRTPFAQTPSECPAWPLRPRRQT